MLAAAVPVFDALVPPVEMFLLIVCPSHMQCLLGTERAAKSLQQCVLSLEHLLTSPHAWLQVSVENYTEWIQLVARLTIDSLNSWQYAKDSVYYLLGLWSRYGQLHRLKTFLVDAFR
eukprot:GHRR01030710.1.p1 GENE.GHRR01030710.1~~GHRR01030710.1.p1  ORF type:complete len:117 (-),score=24.85 GHRR01030710.1:577-927(-)